MAASSTTVPGADANGTALVPTSRIDELDEETARQLVQAMRPVGVSIGVAGIGPVMIGLALLRAAAGGAVEIPGVALAAIFAVSVATPFVILAGQRRAFLAECRSLGIAPALAKKLYRRYALGDFRIETKMLTRDQAERRLAARLLRP